MEGSRLGREASETLYVRKRIVASGVRVFHYLDDRERTLNDLIERFEAQVLGSLDEMERERAGLHAKDGLLQRAQHRYVAGGRVFGDQNRAVLDSLGRRARRARRRRKGSDRRATHLRALRRRRGLRAISHML